MGLKHLKLPKAIVPFGTADGEAQHFTVRGISLPDITSIVRRGGAPVKALFERFTGEEANTAFNMSDFSTIGGDLLKSAPEVAAMIIVAASDGDIDDLDDMSIASDLPFPIQLDALEKIGKLTFDMEGGPKKVLATVIRVAKGTSSLMADVRLSTSGSLVSEAK